MNCKKANDLIMKYMDGSINKDEAFSLKKHIGECQSCYEDFLLYDEILNEFFASANIITAPEGFENKVMEKIYAIGEVYTLKENQSDGLLYAVWGGVSVLCGFGMLLILNKEAIISYINSIPALSGYAEYFAPVENFVIQFKSNVEAMVSAFANSFSTYAYNLKLASLAAFIVLLLAQIIIYKKDKVEAK